MVKLLAVVVVATAIPKLAFARDPNNLVCSGVVNPKDDAERVGVSLNWYDSRADDGSSRKVSIREMWGDLVFGWKRVVADTTKPQHVELRSGKLVRFRGTIQLEVDGKGPALVVVGKISRHPVSDPELHPIEVRLSCVDISI